MKWVVSFTLPAALPFREWSPVIRCIGGWVGPRAGLDVVAKRKIPSPRRESNPDHRLVQSVTSPYTDWAIPAHFEPKIFHIKVKSLPLACLTFVSVTKCNWPSPCISTFSCYPWLNIRSSNSVVRRLRTIHNFVLISSLNILFKWNSVV
jgi:hypothetical protein